MEEIWKDIDGYEGLYQVSNYGRVKSLDRDIYMPNGIIRRHIKEHIVPQYDNRGYQQVGLCKNRKYKREYVHRLVALAFISNPEHKPQVDHINTDRADNVVTNLRWVTKVENQNNPLTKKKTRESLTGKHHSEETKQKISAALIGKPRSEETRKKMSESHRGEHWYNNGEKEVKAFDCPQGFVKGKIKK